MEFQSKLDKIQGLTHPKEWSLVRQTYLDLVLAKMWKTVETISIAPLEKTILLAHEPHTPADQRLVIVPIHQDTSLSTARISELFNTLIDAKLTNDGKELRY
ncbi:hypothetical protein INT45_011233 [Circinella minor]|uniref:tRNA-splicing endonuclease subunit Sen15 domain-containing protein n=1 Tax=Circinella minor TaxID=1195481 RepID=A0A8H7S4U4_9FUNG|nr:hypothetical protein INT45_011233 [Circinella minor]